MPRPRAARKKRPKAKENALPVSYPQPATNPTPETVSVLPELLRVPSIVLPTAGHVVSALALATIIAAIYGVIAWGMFIGSAGFQGHMMFAQRLYDTGKVPIPHFLFHALTGALFAAHLAPSLLFAGRLVVVGCYVLIALVMYGLLWTVFKDFSIGRPSILFLAGLTTLLAEPITLSHAYELGFLWPEPYEIPTSTVLKPFALASFAFTTWYLFRRCKIDLRIVSLFALATLAGSLSKPSFIICLLPASALLLTYRLARGLPVSLAGLLAGLYLPAGAVLSWQFYVTYSGHAANDMYHDSFMWAPFKFMADWATTTGILYKFFLSIVFPLLVTVLYWKQAYRDSMLQLAWLCFLVGAFYTYLIVETVHWSSGNLVWSGYITVFTLFAASMVFWIRQLASAQSGDWSRGRALVCGGAIALHAICGARIDWFYLTHYGCSSDFRGISFMCGG